MATFSNANKNSAVFANQAFSDADMTWDEATFAWDDAGEATWDKPRHPYILQSKNSASFSNQSKN